MRPPPATRSAPVGATVGLVFVGGPTTDLDDAIILVNGSFVQWPEGTQQ